MKILDTVQGLVGSDERIPYLVSLCEQEFQVYTNREEIPVAATGLIVSMVL